MTNLIIENTRTSKVLEAIKNENILETMLNLIHPQQSYGVVMQSNDYNVEQYQGDAIDYENLVISVPIWAKNILDTNDFSKEVSEKLLTWQDIENAHFWDYEIESFLSENGYNEQYEKVYSDYTYNDSEYNRLDRDIHYTVFKYDGDYYLCFAVHHGADARVGFSDSIVLRITDDSGFHHSMNIVIYDTVTDMDYQWYELDNVATFNKETQEWHMNDTNNLVSVYSTANGY